MADLGLSTVVVRSGEPLTAVVDDELVMLDARIGAYFGLDGVGTRIWELLEEPRSVEDLCAVLVSEFDVDLEQCRAELTTFIGELADAQLVELP